MDASAAAAAPKKEKYVPPKQRKLLKAAAAREASGAAAPAQAGSSSQQPFISPVGGGGGSFKRRAKQKKYDKKKLQQEQARLEAAPPPQQQQPIYHSGPPQAALPPIAYSMPVPQQQAQHAQQQQQYDERYGRQSYRDQRDYAGQQHQAEEQRRQWEAQQYEAQMQQQRQWQAQQELQWQQQQEWQPQQQWHTQQQQQQQQQHQGQGQHWPQQQQHHYMQQQHFHQQQQPMQHQSQHWNAPAPQSRPYIPPHRQQQQQSLAPPLRAPGTSWRDQPQQPSSSSGEFARRSSSPAAHARTFHTSNHDDAAAGGGGSRARKNGQRASSPLPLPLAPRTSYLATARTSPTRYPPTSAGVAPRTHPLPLLLLDLNGTLVFRGGASNSANPTRRPYLGAFLAYALGVQTPKMEGERRRNEWSVWQEERDVDFAAGGGGVEMGRPHGADFWPSSSSAAAAGAGEQVGEWKAHPLEPSPSTRATYRLLLWSSAQRRNVDAMARAILAPAQAEHVLRVWARDTLVPHRWMGHKASSTKDLEIVWAALNVDAGETQAQREGEREGEKRLMAQYRAEVDLQFADEEGVPTLSSTEEAGSTGPAAARLAALNAASFIRAPSTSSNEPRGRGYGAHNTLLLDDSPDKARLQPYSHLLLPEFDADRAALVKRWRRERERDEWKASGGASSSFDTYASSQSERDAGQFSRRTPSPSPTSSTPVKEEELDNVLLQLIGVLAHARWEQNVASWIYHGGLGYFGGMTQPGMEAHAKAEPALEHAWKGDEGALRLDMPSEGRTQAFWASEGRVALREAGIACEVD